jgi:hypothetical protein
MQERPNSTRMEEHVTMCFLEGFRTIATYLPVVPGLCFWKVAFAGAYSGHNDPVLSVRAESKETVRPHSFRHGHATTTVAHVAQGA